MNIRKHGFAAAGYSLLFIIIVLFLPQIGYSYSPITLTILAVCFLIVVTAHLILAFVVTRREQMLWFDRVTGEVLRLSNDLDGVESDLRDFREEVASKGQRDRAELISEIRVLQTLLEQVITKSGSVVRESVFREGEGSPPGSQASALKSESQIYEIMRNALNENKVDLFLQPIVALPSRRPVHYECYARVRDTAGEIIFPGDFLPVAGASGLAGTLDNLILFRCLQLARQLGGRRRDVRFFLNISSDSLNDRTFFPQFIDYMLSHDLSDRLVFEFAQRDAAAMSSDVVRQLLSLGKRGYRFSLDQVTDPDLDIEGLAKQFFEFVKIDADKLLAGKFSIHAMDMAGAMKRKGLSLIVSKVEAEREVIEILDFNINLGQGYLFGEPRPAKRLDQTDQIE